MSKEKWEGPSEEEMLERPHRIWFVPLYALITEDKATHETAITAKFYYNEDYFVVVPSLDSDDWKAHESRYFRLYAEARHALDPTYGLGLAADEVSPGGDLPSRGSLSSEKEPITTIPVRSVALGQLFCIDGKVFVRADVPGGNGYIHGFQSIKDECVPCVQLGTSSDHTPFLNFVFQDVIFNHVPLDIKHVHLDEEVIPLFVVRAISPCS